MWERMCKNSGRDGGKDNRRVVDPSADGPIRKRDRLRFDVIWLISDFWMMVINRNRWEDEKKQKKKNTVKAGAQAVVMVGLLVGGRSGEQQCVYTGG